jgi:type IV fimbrial biogenesis protein FimT
MASSTAQRGLTLVELAATLAVLAVTASAAAPGLRSLMDGRRLNGIATTLAADLQLARNEAIARNEPVRVSLHATQQCYVVHTGSASQCDCAAPASPAACTAGATQIRTVRWDASSDALAVQSNSASVLFDPLHGTASPTGTWRVVAADGRAIHQVVNVMGRVRTCAGAGAIPGLRPC